MSEQSADTSTTNWLMTITAEANVVIAIMVIARDL